MASKQLSFRTLLIVTAAIVVVLGMIVVSNRDKTTSATSDVGSSPCDGLQNFNWIRCHPDVEMVESQLQAALEFEEEFLTARCVGRVYKDAEQFIPLHLGLVRPNAADRLCFARDCSELFAQFEDRISDQLVGDSAIIIEP
jgi:hypothetical protein